MADALISVAFETLIPEIRRVYGEIKGVKEEVDKLEEILSLIQDVLEDAEQKQFQDKAVQKWVGRLRDAAYDAEDILDEWATKARKQDDESQSRIFTQVSKSIPHFKLKFNLAKNIKKIIERFDAIQKHSSDFHLMARVANARKEVGESSRPPTDSLVIESEIWGRDDDKKNVIESLLNGINSEKDVFVLPIVGMGGLGKTTLAQLVYNDQRVAGHFDMRMWVCVSENFELIRLASSIFQSASGTRSDLLELDPLQKSLQEKLKGNKFLLVLDDVWNEDPERWDRLKRILNCSKESAIIVTTRIESIASMMGSHSQHYQLKGLSDDQCWTLFKHRAFGGGSKEESPNLVVIGKQIVKKCRGLPLAANALGSLLLSKTDEVEWINIRDSETWKLPNAETNILAALRLSYNHLPFQLKRCFTYCSIFPKDHQIDKENLIYQWIANDFILPNPRMELEDVGNQIFNELVRRSLLQVASRDKYGKIISCQMHDLLHDLGRTVIGNELSTLEHGKVGVVPKETRRLFCDGKIISKSLCEAQKVRSLLFQAKYGVTQSLDFNQNISNLKWLRLLHLRKCDIDELPNSIGHLLHLRYLDLSWNGFTTLPESVCNLQNLQTLILKSCQHLTKLPKGTRKMSRLRHLDVSGCDKLIAMPNKIGQLTSLQKLPTFVVGEGSDCGISQLGDLNLIRGELSILCLERVKNGMNAQDAMLFNKKNLRVLELSWDKGFNDGDAIKSEETLNNLRPCEMLEELMIFNYRGNQFSSWLLASLVPNLVKVDLRRCYNCKSLPPLAQFPYLKHLHIEDMHAVKYIGVDFYGEDKSKSFPSLQEFTLRGMDNLEEWSFVEDKRILFPCLNKLIIRNLQKLSYFPKGLLRDCTMLKTLELHRCLKLRTLGRELDSFVALKSLTIVSCVEMECLSEEGIRGQTCLRELAISGCYKLTTISPVLEGLPSLKTLSIFGCKELVSLPDGIGKLVHLESLRISSCASLTSFPQEGIGGLTSLKVLELDDLDNFTSLPDGIEKLIHLESLEINWCKRLTSFPQEGIGGLTSLKVLKLVHLDNFTSLPDGMGKLIHLEGLTISSCTSLTTFPQEGIGGLTSLKVLKLDDLDNFASLPEGFENLIHLKVLTLRDLHNMTSLPEGIGGLVSLKKLDISHGYRISNLPATLQRLTKIKKLVLMNGGSLNFLPEGGNASLEELIIEDCEDLPEEGVRGMTAIKELHIKNCYNLSTLPVALELLTSLEELEIYFCTKLSHLGRLTTLKKLLFNGGLNFLPEGRIPSLEVLEIRSCEYLTSLPEEVVRGLTALKVLRIANCQKISKLPVALQQLTIQELLIDYCHPDLLTQIKRKRGKEWLKIAHIPIITARARERAREKDRERERDQPPLVVASKCLSGDGLQRSQQGPTKNGRDSLPKNLGVKKFGGEKVIPGNIIVQQRGTCFHPGDYTGMGKDHTLYALKEGSVRFERHKLSGRKWIHVDPLEGHVHPVYSAKNPKDASASTAVNLG